MRSYGLGLSCSSVGTESACNAGDPGLIPGSEDPLEKGMAIHSSSLAWRIPWTEEPGGLQSLGLQRVGHFRATNTTTIGYVVAQRRVNWADLSM